jgi:hypothetical protein
MLTEIRNRFFTYVKSKSRVKSSIGPLKREDNKLTGDSKEMSDILNDCFASVFTNETLDNLPEPRDKFKGATHDVLRVFNITSERIELKLKKLKPNKAPGVDGIGTRLLTELVAELNELLAVLFNRSLENGEVPTDWRMANVTPLFKKDLKITRLIIGLSV